MLDNGTDTSGINQGNKSRWDIEGWVVNGRVTLVKRNEKRSLVGISYVAPYTAGSRELSGTWYSAFARGTWRMEYQGALAESPDDFLNPEASNPPEKRQQ
jgi:hypothetical protein